jgi:hypothetical protein
VDAAHAGDQRAEAPRAAESDRANSYTRRFSRITVPCPLREAGCVIDGSNNIKAFAREAKAKGQMETNDAAT